MNDLIEQTSNGYWVIKSDSARNGEIARRGYLGWDREVLEFVKPYLRSNSCIIDVGAHIGTHTRLYLDCTTDSEIIAYEPNRVAYSCLCKNCPEARNYNLAVGSTLGLASINTDVEESGLSYLYGAGLTQVVSLDDHLGSSVDNVTFIKIDTEGMEPDVLLGAENIIGEFHPVLFIEVYDQVLNRQGHNRSEIFDFINKHGYTFVCEPSWKPVDDIYLNILCT